MAQNSPPPSSHNARTLYPQQVHPYVSNPHPVTQVPHPLAPDASMAMLIWIIALAIITFTLYSYLSPPDVDPYFTRHQASLSQTRTPQESAIARSTVNPHGKPLIAAELQFNLMDLWEDNWSVSIVRGPVISETSVSISKLVAEYSLSLRALSVNGSKVIIALPESPEMLAILFAAKFQGLTPYFTRPSQLQDAVTALRPGSIILDSKTDISGINIGDAIPVSIDGGSADVMPLTSFKGGSPPPSPRPSEIAFGIFDERIYNITHTAVGKTVAAQLASLGQQERWTAKDKMLQFSLYPSLYSLIMSFVCLGAKGHLLYMDHAFTDPFTLVEKTQPTVIVTDDLSVRSLIRKTDDFRLAGWLGLQFRYLLQQKGRLWLPMLREFNSVRLVFTCAVLSDRHGALTANETRTARALLGCQLVHALCDPLPLCQTTFGDYHVTPKKINFGPPVPGLNLRLALESSDYAYKGELEFSFGKNWNKTGQEGYLLKDGCFYLDEPEPDVVDVYTEDLRAAAGSTEHSG